jgi:hypothetical protein
MPDYSSRYFSEELWGCNSESEGEDNDDEHKANFISQILEMLGQFLKEVLNLQESISSSKQKSKTKN